MEGERELGRREGRKREKRRRRRRGGGGRKSMIRGRAGRRIR